MVFSSAMVMLEFTCSERVSHDSTGRRMTEAHLLSRHTTRVTDADLEHDSGRDSDWCRGRPRAIGVCSYERRKGVMDMGLRSLCVT